MNNTIAYRRADLQAHLILTSRDPRTTDLTGIDILNSGNEIILLAERIKAERASAAIQK